MPSVNEEIGDELIDRAVRLERYKSNVITQVLLLLARLEESVVARLVKLDPNAVQDRYKRARLTRLLAEIQSKVDEYGKAVETLVLPDMRQLARDEGRMMSEILSDAPPVSLELVSISNSQLQAAAMTRPFQGRLLKEWVADHTPAVRARLRRVIRQGVVEGQTIDEMIRSIRGTRAENYRNGIMEINRRGAAAMVRTAVNHTVTAAREIVYEQNDDIIKGVRWVSTLDSKTSAICQARDGKVYPLNKGPRPPAHINCRSSTAPILKSWKELGIDLSEAPEGTRASMDGQVPANQTYEEWLKKRPAEFQDGVLGKTRGDLFRRGKLTLDKFVDKSGRKYNLDELRRREPKAFKKAA